MSDIIIYKNNDECEEMWANDLVKDEQVNFEGWICGIGLESIDIKSNGDMYRGTCRVGGKIGHVDDTEWNLPTNFIACDKTSCTCVADIKSTRYKDENVRESLKYKIHENILEKHGDKNSINY